MMCFWGETAYVELQVDPAVVVQRVDDHQVEVLLCETFRLRDVVLALDAVHDERYQDLQARVLLHHRQHSVTRAYLARTARSSFC